MAELKQIDINGPNQDVIEHLEDLMQKAKDGEIQGIAYATYLYGGVTQSGWSKQERISPVLGELNVLRARIEMSVLRNYYPKEVSGDA